MVDVAVVAGQVLPYLSAAAGAYGHAVVARVTEQAEEATADAAASWGRRLLQRLLRSAQSHQIGAAVTDLANHPDNEDFAAAVRAQVRTALAEDAGLAQEVAAMVAEAAAMVAEAASAAKTSVQVTGSQGVQIGDRNTQTNTFTAPPS